MVSPVPPALGWVGRLCEVIDTLNAPSGRVDPFRRNANDASLVPKVCHEEILSLLLLQSVASRKPSRYGLPYHYTPAKPFAGILVRLKAIAARVVEEARTRTRWRLSSCNRSAGEKRKTETREGKPSERSGRRTIKPGQKLLK